MEETRPFQSISDDELLRRLAELMSQSRRVEADIVAHIAEVDERRLYAREAFPSMFVYCMAVLHLSEAEAYLRILAGRATREHPMLLTMLADGRLHLTAIVKLAPHLTRENRDGLLKRATHRSKLQILALVAEIAPRPDVPATIRKLPARRTCVAAGFPEVLDGGGLFKVGRGPISELGLDAVATPELRPDAVATPGLGPAPAVVEPLSPGRYKVQFTASADFREKLERLRALTGAKGRDGDLGALIEEAVTEKLERLEARLYARTRAPRRDRAERETETDTATETAIEPGPRPSSSRHIPAAIRRAVRERDQGRCAYVDEQGRRCPEERWLEFHHRHPFALGGPHSVVNVGLVCRAHNLYMAECDYGREVMAQHRRPRRRTSPAAV